MNKLKAKVALSIASVFTAASASANEAPAYQAILDALNFDSAMPLVIAGGAAIVAWAISKGAIMGLVQMIRGAAR